MQLSQSEKISQTSFSMLKAKLQQDSKRKRIDQRNNIKVNRRKLPSDFFKGSLEKNLARKSPVDPYFDLFGNEKTLFLLKQPQTQRKIQSYQCLPSSDPEQNNDFQYGRCSIVRTKEHSSILHRKALEKQVDDIKGKAKKSRFDKPMDCVKLKCLRQKESEQIIKRIENFQTQSKKKSINPVSGTSPIRQFEGFIGMGCTFGRGFKNKVDFSLQSSVMLKQNTNDTSQFVNEQILQNQSFGLNQINDKKQGYEKSTEQSQVFQNTKSKQYSPIRQKIRKKILKKSDEIYRFNQPKSLSAQKSIINQDLSLFNDLPMQKSKLVFTAQEKQRKMRNRINSSSTDHRSVKIRKDKKIEDLNLPKIGKVVSFHLDLKN